ncbi:MAG: serine/threonine-protein kinase [Nannocystaceae bacterium]|nr:serine/threonine-protein kinase [Nannocystaceae bacterium]
MSAVDSDAAHEATLPATASPEQTDEALEGVLTALGRAATQARLFDRERPVLLGRYVVLKHLGSGGMGDVVAAYDPQLDRKVAVKLLRGRSEADDPAHARLLREAQAMARLSHPNVIAVHDVGTHGSRVFVAMELIDGVTLRQWAAEPRTLEAVMAVLLAVARGVAAAHGAGVIHRDLKPDNVMVGDDGRVRVMDFGLARPVAEPTTLPGRGEDEVFRASSRPQLDAMALPLTQVGAIVGTPAYMSPEQLRGLELDARSDQFSFCVLAWEALEGRRPFVGGTVGELLDAMAKRRFTPSVGGLDVPGWLRAALERGLAAAPEDRFATMTALIEALERGRARVRGRRLVTAAVAAGVIGLGGLGARQAVRARVRQGCADEGATIAATWNDDARARLASGLAATGAAMADDTLQRALPWIDRFGARWQDARTTACERGELEASWDADTTARARQCLDERRDELTALLSAFEHADTAMLSRVVPAFAGLTGIDACHDVAALARMPLRRDDASAAELRARLVDADGRGQAGRYADAAAAATAIATEAVAAGDEGLAARAWVVAGRNAEKAGDGEASARALRDGFALAGRLGLDTVAADAATALVYTTGEMLRQSEAAFAWGATAQVLVARAGEDEGMRGATLWGQLGTAHWRAAQYEQSVAMHERALALKRRILGESHPAVAITIFNLANARDEQGEHDRALAEMLEALAMFERELGPNHPSVGNCANNLGSMVHVRGELDQAVRWYERALAVKEANFGADSIQLTSTLGNLGNLEIERGDLARARQLHGRALALRRARFGESHLDVADSMSSLAKISRSEGDLLGALRQQRAALEIREQALPADHPDVIDSLLALGLVHASLGEDPQARDIYQRALAAAERRLGPDSLDVATALHGLANVDRRQGRPGDAVPRLERALAIRERAKADLDLQATARESLAYALADSGGDVARARAIMLQARREFDASPDPRLRERVAPIDAWLAAHP